MYNIPLFTHSHTLFEDPQKIHRKNRKCVSNNIFPYKKFSMEVKEVVLLNDKCRRVSQASKKKHVRHVMWTYLYLLLLRSQSSFLEL